MPNYATVVPDTKSVLPIDVFTYSVPDAFLAQVEVGTRVEVPFGSREVVAYVIGRPQRSEHDEVRAITGVLDEEPLLQPHQVELASWIANHYCAPLGEVIKAMLPAGIRSARPGGRARGPRTKSKSLEGLDNAAAAEVAPELTQPQSVALEPVLEAIAQQQHLRLLLHGVTGSGKTEVYLRAIAAAQAAGRQAIVLVPEIALTPQTVRRFAARFPGRVAVSHSGLTEAERAEQWRKIRGGEIDVVVGSRSAVFAPVQNLGVVIVDEEDATAYKQDRVPRYHAVDVALELGRLHSAPVVLGSATPRVETFFRAHGGDMQLATLDHRVNGRELPAIDIVDLREELNSGNRSPLSTELQKAMIECHEAGGQMILFLNRRGSSTVVVCRSCGEALTCASCSVAMVYHHGERVCSCHYCGATCDLPTVCPSCKSTAIRGLGMGTEKLEQEVHELLPIARLLRMDRDTTTTRDAYFSIYEAFRAGEADCMIGTQMVAKGWDLANVRLVGIVNADTSLHMPDYRSGEITFSLLTQVAGRAGRGDEPARVILQTYSPEHYAVRHSQTHDYLGFAREEIRFRKLLKFPPYSQLVTCTVSHSQDDMAESAVQQAVKELADALAADPALSADIDILGPAPAFIHRLRGEYRWQFTARGHGLERIFAILPRGKGKGSRWSIDVDPAP